MISNSLIRSQITYTNLFTPKQNLTIDREETVNINVKNFESTYIRRRDKLVIPRRLARGVRESQVENVIDSMRRERARKSFRRRGSGLMEGRTTMELGDQEVEEWCEVQDLCRFLHLLSLQPLDFVIRPVSLARPMLMIEQCGIIGVHGWVHIKIQPKIKILLRMKLKFFNLSLYFLNSQKKLVRIQYKIKTKILILKYFSVEPYQHFQSTLN